MTTSPTTVDPSLFKAYDMRGIYGQNLTDEVAYRIGRATALYLNIPEIAVGRDMRLSSPQLAAALIFEENLRRYIVGACLYNVVDKAQGYCMLDYMHLDPIYRRYHHHNITFSLMYAYSENFLAVLPTFSPLNTPPAQHCHPEATTTDLCINSTENLLSRRRVSRHFCSPGEDGYETGS